MASRQTTFAVVLLLALLVGSSATYMKRPPKPAIVLRSVYMKEGLTFTPDFILNKTTGYATYSGTLYSVAPPPQPYRKPYGKGPNPNPYPQAPVPVGSAYGTLTVVKGGPLPALVASFTWDIFGKGQITAYGLIDRALPTAKYAITGGTDQFRGLDGDVLVQRVPPTFPAAIIETTLAFFADVEEHDDHDDHDGHADHDDHDD